MRNHLFTVYVILTALLIPNFSYAQCCAGGSGSPVAGNASQGVLQKHQMELNTNLQYISTNKFYAKDKLSTESTFDSYSSMYEYFKLAYGLTDKLTISLESGYYFQKKEVGKNGDPNTTYETNGFGDLIIFPRYQVLNKRKGNYKTELTVGLGIKIPIGSYNDSTAHIEPFSGQTYYVTNPTAVQLSSGATDIILYSFFSKSLIKQKMRFFANAYFIKKGYNPNGERLGNYASFSLFANKTILKHMGVTLQARYEWTDQMTIIDEVLLFGRPSNYNPDATGYRKLFVTPQISYSMKKLSVYTSTDIPLYQYLNSSPQYTQVGSQLQITVGLSYRFFVKKDCDIE